MLKFIIGAVAASLLIFSTPFNPVSAETKGAEKMKAAPSGTNLGRPLSVEHGGTDGTTKSDKGAKDKTAPK